MWTDPIVEETRKIRDEMAARFDYDVKALGQYYKSKEPPEGRTVVSRPPKLLSEEKEEQALISDRA